ncbi:MAG: RND transporter [gamma proteobacterium symbiont of Bathyaustriella thionipta]|nr:RND transporter [gamma proteobacterium symbiont of Bathyaustriella thionipta]MCU7951744.1 RND transporter [gamma proteobacterium symbiont of Bathyaustriella thionipta]MCU7958347.1 RND transporter [gamma proteobacterium symbiont of Bathyaustriella thionipta]MCU7965829.1 RND transporter [gamma proteobacterium symbiont of Bathyaustriella thionipta]
MIRFLNNLSFPMLIIMAVLLGTAPIGAEPHLIEKINMLLAGTLAAPLDIFDLVFHSLPFILLAIKLFLFVKNKSQKKEIEGS